MTTKNIREEIKDFRRGEGEYSMHSLTEKGVNSAVDLFLSRNIAIPRTELPEVKNYGSYATVGTYTMAGHDFTSADRGYKDMLSVIAWHEYLLAQDAKEAETTAARAKRRGELLREFEYPIPHLVEASPLARAINMILDMEAAQ